MIKDEQLSGNNKKNSINVTYTITIPFNTPWKRIHFLFVYINREFYRQRSAEKSILKRTEKLRRSFGSPGSKSKFQEWGTSNSCFCLLGSLKYRGGLVWGSANENWDKPYLGLLRCPSQALYSSALCLITTAGLIFSSPQRNIYTCLFTAMSQCLEYVH